MRLGFKGRFFPRFWRSAESELRFASASNFEHIEAATRYPRILDAELLGGELASVAEKAKSLDITLSYEHVIPVDPLGRAIDGSSVSSVFERQARSLVTLGCKVVHCHLVPLPDVERSLYDDAELRLCEDLSRAVAIARDNGFTFAFEHNEPRLSFFSSAPVCRALLDAVPDIAFVWDINHTPEHETGAFYSLFSRTAAVHVADTPLPELNHHLPLGAGTVDFETHLTQLKESGFTGPLVLEVGGLPISGGPGKDTDEVLLSSLGILRKAAGVTACARQA